MAAVIPAAYVLSAPALAGDPPTTAPVQSAVISGDAFVSRGALRVNQAAGNGNVQANVAAVLQHGAPIHVTVRQTTNAAGIDSGNAAIDGFAFSGAYGLVQLNQSAGSGNAEGNVALIRTGVPVRELNDGALAATVPVQVVGSVLPTPIGAKNVASSAQSAFAHAGGIVQINQTAGDGNATVNTLLLQIPQNAGH